MRLVPRHRLDIRPGDLAHGFGLLASAGKAADQTARLESVASPRGEALATLSVRSAFDLLLDALEVRPGDEVVMSAVTIPDMGRVVRARGAHVVPVDVAQQTLAPRPEWVKASLSSRTRAIILAHLYGGRMDLTPFVELAARAGVPLIEDCAQAFTRPDALGDPRALASLFSFGPLKTLTALGGALTVVRDGAVRARMRELQSRWPVQPREELAGRLLRFSALLGIQPPRVFGTLSFAAKALGVDLEKRLGGAVKSFSVDAAQMLRGIRQRPCAPLLALLSHRLQTFDDVRLLRRTELGERARGEPWAQARMPGVLQPERTHWLVPYVADDAPSVVALLRANGFDAAQGTTSLTVVPDESGALPPGASRWLPKVVYLPLFPEVSDVDADRLLGALSGAETPECPPITGPVTVAEAS